MIHELSNALEQLRQVRPLVLNLTNYVTMDFMANALLALGASPIMSVSEEELAELINLSHSVCLNLGTLNEAFIERCYQALKWAKYYQKPVVLDPVGAGASLLRTNTAKALLPEVDILRGNASEIIALTTEYDRHTKGVDASHCTLEAKEKAQALAKRYKCTVIVSGEVDFICDSANDYSLTFGSPLMPLVTGMGCTLTAVIAAFRSVISNSFEAGVQATAYFGLCGNAAATKASTPAAFRTAFIDELYYADFNHLGTFCQNTLY